MSEFWKEKNVVVTGGLGFLGYHVVKELGKHGAWAGHISRRTGVDLRNLEQTLDSFYSRKPHIVINCAAHQGGIAYQQLKPASICRDNILMSINTMEAARLAEVDKYINIIAGCAYPGASGYTPWSEYNIMNGPMHSSVENYAIAKRAALIYARCCREQYGFNAISVVLPNMYGPRDHFGTDRSHALAALLRRFYEAKRDGLESVTVWGSGKPIREWLYVEDAAEGILRLAEAHNDHSPVNIATGRGYTEFDITKPDGAMRKTFSGHEMKQILNWEPGTSLKAGIVATLDWATNNGVF
jgi:GDP-L-fucose synthase